MTPWLSAFTANPGCGGTTNRSLEGVVAPAKVAAGRAGFDPAHYDDVIYAIADSHCGFHGATWGNEVMLTRQPNLQLVVHELGHAFGLGHAQAADCIDRRRRRAASTRPETRSARWAAASSTSAPTRR